MSALQGGTAGIEGASIQFGEPARNDSKGCGGVMRSAPYGWLADGSNEKAIYELAVEAAGYTHGHPTGQVASGALALIIGSLMQGQGLDTAVKRTLTFLSRRKYAGETVALLRRASDLAMQPDAIADPAAALRSLGAGWIAEEALAMGVFAAARYADVSQAIDALSLAVSHGGDSDSTGSICGNILGALHGEGWVPASLAFQVEGRSTMLELADDFVYLMGDRVTPTSALPMMLNAEGNQRRAGLSRAYDLHLLDSQAWFDRYPPG
jgi:ADP-ribosylglycohydrolase